MSYIFFVCLFCFVFNFRAFYFINFLQAEACQGCLINLFLAGRPLGSFFFLAVIVNFFQVEHHQGFCNQLFFSAWRPLACEWGPLTSLLATSGWERWEEAGCIRRPEDRQAFLYIWKNANTEYSVTVIKRAIQRSGKTLADLDQLVYGSS